MGIFRMGTVECPEASRATGVMVGGYLEDSSAIEIPLVVVNGAGPGPVLWIGGAVHAPEITGVEIIRRITRELVDPAQLRGTIVGAPIQNPLGFRDHHRLILREGTDLNRAFPGNLGSSLTEEMAFHLFTEGFSRANCVLDIHSSGNPAFPYLLVRGGSQAAERAMELAQLFECAIILSLLQPGEAMRGTLMDAALVAGIPAITLEFPFMHVLDEEAVQTGIRGILNVMRALEMIPGPPEPPARRPIQEVLGNTILVRARRGGFLHPLAKVGSRLQKDDPLFQVRDPYGDLLETVVSPIDGYMLLYHIEGNQSCFSGQAVGLVNPIRS